ncbi:YggS family pyridoxal phosphate-dependent enzyme [Moheibacter sediminis]|uniref:Pyridoxal phosphate homeostasis protein n=1 Tax=Moheibacter sediminis TaxID=1434700 RepID=A0A1W2BU63_9FLAO|nr:YggS family pyridoxal phosphate-dependent enzyme [Moheibacter sediminis]SMC76274.1 hypothetical protein SAMN06296427_107126 [Moheibacter sediminis]
MSIVENLQQVQNELPENVTLVAVSKTKPAEAIQELYDAGQIEFGENKVQELVSKYEFLPKDIKWHLIGHLQKNKVKYITEFVYLIHSVDNLDLLKEINKQAAKCSRIIPCLLQIKIAEEDSKFGMYAELAEEIISNYKSDYPNVEIVGLMGMSTFTEDENQIRSEFKYLKSVFDKLRTQNSELKTLSMGMSGDFKIAIEEGSTMVRVGSSIFGERNYH